MAKRNRPVLYEVARRHPTSMRRDEEDGGRRQRFRPAAPPPPPAAPEPEPAPPTSSPPPISAAPVIEPTARKPHAAEIAAEDRAKSVLADGPIGASEIPGPGLSLSDRGPLIVAGVATAFVVLFLAFALIQRMARETPAADEPAAAPAAVQADAALPPAEADQEPPRVEVAVAAPPEAEPPAPPQQPTVELRTDQDYVVVQYFPRSRQRDAEKVAMLLIQNGIPAALLPGARDIRLIATEPFHTNQPDAQAARKERERAQALVARIKALGKQHMPEGYDLSGAALRPIR